MDGVKYLITPEELRAALDLLQQLRGDHLLSEQDRATAMRTLEGLLRDLDKISTPVTRHDPGTLQR